jgi:hypothetical protein
MSEGKVLYPKSRRSRGLLSRMEPLSEKSKLKSIIMALPIREGSSCIPPLRPEGSVRPVISWEHIIPARLRDVPDILSRNLSTPEKGRKKR